MILLEEAETPDPELLSNGAVEHGGIVAGSDSGAGVGV